MLVEFKEKTYEKYFCAELARLTNVMFSPDQCDEFFIGIDEAVLLPEYAIPYIFPFRRRSRWSRFHGISLSDVDWVADELSQRLPNFRTNFFIQYKRPEYMIRSSACEWHFWDKKYYRYDITLHQQEALIKLNQYCSGRAFVAYASPSFFASSLLWGLSKNNKIIQNSNIADVSLMAGHERFTYSSPGNLGIACSEPINIESSSFELVLSARMENAPMPFRQHIEKIAKVIRQVAEELRIYEDLELAVAANLGEALEGESFLRTLATVSAFAEMTGTEYYAIG